MVNESEVHIPRDRLVGMNILTPLMTTHLYIRES